ncbi:MAG TPA: MarR family transcriptional regulator [Nannocystaceae bacterium]|nr:MarR family transcriptional regulator [Nannocystaceae bacterium]
MLLRDLVASFEQLEALLALHRAPAQWLDVLDLAERIGAPTDALEDALDELHTRGLVQRQQSEGTQRWRFAPSSGAAERIDRLVDICQRQRLEVMRILSAQAMDRIRNAASRAFADAFLIGRKRDA